MLRTIAVYGLPVGLFVGGQLFVLTLLKGGDPVPPWGAAVGYLTMLAALAFVFVAVKRRRDREGGGAIKFWPAFGLGLGISAVAAVVYVLAWELALAVTGLDFAGEYARQLIEKKRAGGASPAELQAFAAEMRRFQDQYANPLFRLPMTFSEFFPLGALVSLVSAALLRNSRFLPARAAR